MLMLSYKLQLTIIKDPEHS